MAVCCPSFTQLKTTTLTPYPPTAAPASSAPPQGMPQLPPGIDRQGLARMLASPQGRMLVQAALSNPAILQQVMASNPALANNPEARGAGGGVGEREMEGEERTRKLTMSPQPCCPTRSSCR